MNREECVFFFWVDESFEECSKIVDLWVMGHRRACVCVGFFGALTVLRDVILSWIDGDCEWAFEMDFGDGDRAQIVPENDRISG